MIQHTLKSGAIITIEIEEYCQQISPKVRDASGKTIASGQIIKTDKLSPRTKNSIPAEYRQGYYIIGNVLLPDNVGQMVIDALDAKKAEIAATPEGIKNRLRSEREALVDEINGALDEADRAKDRSYESGEGTGQWVFAGRKWEERADAAKAKLVAFDKVHPEIIEGIKKEKSEAADRHTWD